MRLTYALLVAITRAQALLIVIVKKFLRLKLSQGKAVLYMGTSSSMGRVRIFTGLGRMVEREGTLAIVVGRTVSTPFPFESLCPSQTC